MGRRELPLSCHAAVNDWKDVMWTKFSIVVVSTITEKREIIIHTLLLRHLILWY